MNTATILVGDVRRRLAEIPDGTIHCCITSPPYWGLRNYGQDGQIGLEVSPAGYVTEMVDVFREVKRVLRDDGVLWLNLGDTYVGTGSKGDCKDPKYAEGRNGQTVAINNKVQGLKSKDLVGIPWRVAFALQDDGWYLRQDVIWHKPNPMPESVTDRCTKSHEYLFMLTKSPHYYFDNRAIQEEATGYDGRKATVHQPSEKYGETELAPNLSIQSIASKPTERWKFDEDGIPVRNKRSVWSVPTKPFKGAHFAVMPEALVDPCIRASISLHGCCAQCHAPYQRQLEWGEAPERAPRENLLNVIPGRDKPSRLQSQAMEKRQSATIGWQKTCTCDTTETTESLVLDPFTGSGTVAVVALRYKANFIGTELNPDYVAIANERITSDQPLFNTVHTK